MEFDVITKFFFGIVSALGTIAVVFLNSRQAAKVKAELLEKFEVAIEKKQKHSAAELFLLIHGIRMSYADIEALTFHDDCSKIIHALKKTPGFVSYKDGNFEYSGVGKSPIFRLVDRWLTKIGIIIFSSLTFLSLLVLVFGKSGTALVGFVFMIICVAALAFQLRQRNYDQMIENLVVPEHNKSIQLAAEAPAD